MKRIGENAEALRRSEEGWTLLEMLVAVTVGMLVLGGAVTMLMGAVKSGPRASAKVEAVQEGRVALERITRELRQGLDVVSAGSSELKLLTFVKESPCGGSPSSTATACLVTYSCTAGTCTRVAAQPNESSPGPTRTVVTDLANTSVFGYTPSAAAPEYVAVEFSFDKAQGTDPVVLADGATMRNRD